MSTESNKKIIWDTYLKILKREPDEVGFDHYLNLFQNGTLDKEKLISLMKNGEEYKPIQLAENFIKKYDLLLTQKNTEEKIQRYAKVGENEKLISNFFWYGDNFSFLNNIVIKSHIKVDHHPKIWVSGKIPSNKYWKDIESKITIIDITKDFDVKEFLTFGGNLRIASDLWRFHFLYACGGFYSDMDNFMIKHIPNDRWVVCSAENELLNIGFIKCPPKSPVFLKCIKNLKIQWGGVQTFTDTYREVFGNIKPTHESKLFYPYHWKNALQLFEDVKLSNDIFSIHFYQGKLEHSLGEDLNLINEKWCEKNPNTLLGKLWKSVNS
jgi:hypothetical protein